MKAYPIIDNKPSQKKSLPLFSLTITIASMITAVFSGQVVQAKTKVFAPSYGGWRLAHSDTKNTGFANVVTAPAVNFSTVVDVGPLAHGANPVTGKDGTVYVGNLNGELIALHPDGSVYWKRKLETNRGTSLGGIYASPAIGNDGSIYVVSGYGFRDHRKGNPPVGASSFLHKFTPGGGWLGQTPFPSHYGGTGATQAPPNIWNYKGTEAIVIPVQFGHYGELTHLLAFSTNLGVMGDTEVTPGQITGGATGWLSDVSEGLYCIIPLTGLYDLLEGLWGGHSYCALGGFTSRAQLDPSLIYSYLGSTKGVAIRQDSTTESPHIFVVDGLLDTVEFLFDINTGFHGVKRTHSKDRINLSSPVALSTGGIAIGKHTPHESLGGIAFEPEQRYLWLDGDIYATPTVTPNGRIAAVANTGWLSTIFSGSVEKQQWNNGPSIASAASSCTHLFVATENELVTYDLHTMQPINRLPWTDGGNHSTIIGPTGYVYATTERGIFVFPPAPNRNPNDLAGTECGSGSLVQPPPATTTVPSVQDFTVSEAAQTLQAAGLVVGTQHSVNDRLCNNIGLVVDQNPRAGTPQVPKGSAVDLWIGKKPPSPFVCP